VAFPRQGTANQLQYAHHHPRGMTVIASYDHTRFDSDTDLAARRGSGAAVAFDLVPRLLGNSAPGSACPSIGIRYTESAGRYTTEIPLSLGFGGWMRLRPSLYAVPAIAPEWTLTRGEHDIGLSVTGSATLASGPLFLGGLLRHDVEDAHTSFGIRAGFGF